MCENILGYAYASYNGKKFLVIHLDHDTYVNYCTNQSNENDLFGILAEQILESLEEHRSIIFTPCDPNHPLEYRGNNRFINYLICKEFTYDRLEWQENI